MWPLGQVWTTGEGTPLPLPRLLGAWPPSSACPVCHPPAWLLQDLCLLGQVYVAK